MYVIKYDTEDNSTFNLGQGHEANFDECTKYATRAEAEAVAEKVMGVKEILHVSEVPGCVGVISFPQLADAIEAATRTMTVLVPCRDYYARRGDSSEEELTYIDPELLVNALRGTS